MVDEAPGRDPDRGDGGLDAAPSGRFVRRQRLHNGTTEAASLNSLQPYIESILRSTLTLAHTTDWPSDRILQLVAGNLTIGIPVEPNLELQQVVKKVKKQIEAKHKECSRLQDRVASPSFREKAEPAVIQESEERVISLRQELALLTSSEQQLATMLR